MQCVAFTAILKAWRYPATPKTIPIPGIKPETIYKPHTPNDQLRFVFSLEGLGNARYRATGSSMDCTKTSTN